MSDIRFGGVQRRSHLLVRASLQTPDDYLSWSLVQLVDGTLQHIGAFFEVRFVIGFAFGEVCQGVFAGGHRLGAYDVQAVVSDGHCAKRSGVGGDGDVRAFFPQTAADILYGVLRLVLVAEDSSSDYEHIVVTAQDVVFILLCGHYAFVLLFTIMTEDIGVCDSDDEIFLEITYVFVCRESCLYDLDAVILKDTYVVWASVVVSPRVQNSGAFVSDTFEQSA